MLPHRDAEEAIDAGTAIAPFDQDGNPLYYDGTVELEVQLDDADSEAQATTAQGDKPKPLQCKETIRLKSLHLRPYKYTEKGSPSCNSVVIQHLAGKPFKDPPKWGSAYEDLGGGEKGAAACKGLASLIEAEQIGTIIETFMTSLPGMVDKESRVHTSINLNTETGRLSSQRPNLQNQPALEKDVYKIRKAFRSSEGKKFVICDYGQLELRVLAHMTNCKSMIKAFEDGGDFHSRTAVDMYDNVRGAVESGAVLLEWDGAKGKPTAPMLKDKFANERKKAKTLNFSIAYGKTKVGVADILFFSCRLAFLLLAQ